MDTGGLAHMAYNNYPTNSGLAVPGAGYGSRNGKSGHIKRLSVAPPPTINSIYEEDADPNANGRTSRASMLSGLRTAPRQSSGGNLSAPYSQTHHRVSSDISGYNGRNSPRGGQDMPQTAVGSQFTGLNGHNPYAQQQQQYAPEQVLAPQFEPAYATQDQMDPQVYEELLATNMYLVQRQQQLQQQLLNVTAAANQFQGMNLNAQPQISQNPQSLYHQQMQSGVQPIVTPVPNQPGVYLVYNPLTGQQNYMVDQSGQLAQMSATPPYGAAYNHEAFEPEPATAKLRPPMVTPPKKTPSPPTDVAPLPAPSSNAFRAGHRKSSSIGGYANRTFDGVRNSALKSAGLPGTPQAGTFGPGMGRAGEHPTRQPRGPPPMEELLAAPTTKHEGSKNFAARQRRRALNSLVRASNERRSGRTSNGAGTPSSESELTFSAQTPASDAGDSDFGMESGRPSPSLHQLRGSVTGAIGSEWKELRERSRSRGPTPSSSNSRSVYSAGSGYGGRSSASGEKVPERTTSASRIGWTIESFDDDAGNATGVEVSGNAYGYGIGSGGYAGAVSSSPAPPTERRGTPKLVLTSAEKRKSSIF